MAWEFNYKKAWNEWSKPEFDTHVAGTDLCNEELEVKYAELVAPSFIVKSVRHCNYKPHPFCIGPEHFPKDGSMFIKPEQAPCAVRGCNLSLEEHTSDKVLFLSLPKNLKKDVANDKLKTITDEMTKDKIDGVAFVEGEGKFI